MWPSTAANMQYFNIHLDNLSFENFKYCIKTKPPSIITFDI